MRQLCYRITAALGTSWGVLGWALFLGVLSLQFFLPRPVVAAVWIGLLIWWVVDLIDQEVAFWKVLVGLVMIGISLLPRGGALFVACWVLYWMKVRD